MASDFFVKIDGIDGESNDKNHSKIGRAHV